MTNASQKPFEYLTIDGKKTAVVNVVVDPQRGFYDLSLLKSMGGVLGVPGGHEVIPPIGKLVSESRNSIFIVSNDWHSDDHIADMDNHPGVVAYRKELLEKAGKDPEDYLKPWIMPFSELVLDKNGDIVGILDEDREHILKVEVKTADGKPPSAEDRGRVASVSGERLEQTFHELTGASTQTLWAKHCVQATPSAQMANELNLPKPLMDQLEKNQTKLLFQYDDEATGNRFYVVRKGVNSERDSNGVLIENDRTTSTVAEGMLKDLAKQFRADGVEHVQFNYMGLATNFCVEFSANQISAIANGYFDIAGMSTQHSLVTEACRGIPIEGGKDVPFSLAGTLPRLQEKRGFEEATVNQILAHQKPGLSTSGENLNATSGQQLHVE